MLKFDQKSMPAIGSNDTINIYNSWTLGYVNKIINLSSLVKNEEPNMKRDVKL